MSPKVCELVFQAYTVRDALAKGLYLLLFRWLVRRCNNALAAYEAEVTKTAGILDIFGFEKFEVVYDSSAEGTLS